MVYLKVVTEDGKTNLVTLKDGDSLGSQLSVISKKCFVEDLETANALFAAPGGVGEPVKLALEKKVSELGVKQGQQVFIRKTTGVPPAAVEQAAPSAPTPAPAIQPSPPVQPSPSKPMETPTPPPPPTPVLPDPLPAQTPQQEPLQQQESFPTPAAIPIPVEPLLPTSAIAAAPSADVIQSVPEPIPVQLSPPPIAVVSSATPAVSDQNPVSSVPAASSAPAALVLAEPAPVAVPEPPQPAPVPLAPVSPPSVSTPAAVSSQPVQQLSPPVQQISQPTPIPPAPISIPVAPAAIFQPSQQPLAPALRPPTPSSGAIDNPIQKRVSFVPSVEDNSAPLSGSRSASPMSASSSSPSPSAELEQLDRQQHNSSPALSLPPSATKSASPVPPALISAQVPASSPVAENKPVVEPQLPSAQQSMVSPPSVPIASQPQKPASPVLEPSAAISAPAASSAAAAVAASSSASPSPSVVPMPMSASASMISVASAGGSASGHSASVVIPPLRSNISSSSSLSDLASIASSSIAAAALSSSFGVTPSPRRILGNFASSSDDLSSLSRDSPRSFMDDPLSSSVSESPRTSLSGFSYDESDSFRSKRTSLESARSSLDLSSPYSNLVRDKLEDDLESQFFANEGQGEIRVLVAMKAVQQVPEEKRRDRKKKEDRIVAVVRDWTGAYALFFFKQLATGILGKKLVVFHAIPILHDEPFAFEEIKGDRDNTHFILRLDKIVEMELMTTTKQRVALEEAVQLAMEDMKHLTKNDIQSFILKLCAIDFVQSYREDASALTAINADNRAKDCMSLKDIYSDDSGGQLFLALRRVCGSSVCRDAAINRIIKSFILAKATPKEAHVFLECLEHTLHSPCASSQPDLKAEIMGMLDKIGQKFSLGSGGDVTARCMTLKPRFQALHAAMDVWSSRRNMLDVPFPREFFHSKGSKFSKKNLMTKAVRIETMSAKRLPGSCVYLGVLAHSQSSNEIFGDKNENIPVAMLENSRAFVGMDSSHSVFQWLMSLGPQWCKLLASNSSVYENSSSPFVRSLCMAVNTLRQQLGVLDLGLLFDRPVFLKDINATLILAVLPLDDRPDAAQSLERKIAASASAPSSSSSSLSDGFKMHPALDFEHRTYQKYNGLDLVARLEPMSDGPRWIKAACVFSHAYPKSKLAPGVHLGYMHLASHSKGLHVLVRSDSRSMVPSAHVSRMPMTTEEWEWVQSYRLRAERGGQQLTAEIPASEVMDRPWDSLSFIQRFARAMHEIMSELRLPDLGALYDLEVIELDEKNSVKLILFVCSGTSLDLPSSLASRFAFRPLQAFESFMYHLYAPHLYREYISSLATAVEATRFTPRSAFSLEEILAGRAGASSLPVLDLIEREKKWIPMQWPARVAEWTLRGTRSIMERVPSRASKTVQQILAEANALQGKTSLWYFQEARRIMTEDLQRDQTPPWSKIERQMVLLEGRFKAAASQDVASSQFLAVLSCDFEEAMMESVEAGEWEDDSDQELDVDDIEEADDVSQSAPGTSLYDADAGTETGTDAITDNTEVSDDEQEFDEVIEYVDVEVKKVLEEQYKQMVVVDGFRLDADPDHLPTLELVPFSLDEMDVDVAAVFQPSSLDICELIVLECIEAACVESIEGAIVREVQASLCAVLDIIETVDDMAEEAMLRTLKAEEINRTIAASAKQISLPSLASDSESGPVPYDALIQALTSEFQQSVLQGSSQSSAASSSSSSFASTFLLKDHASEQIAELSKLLEDLDLSAEEHKKALEDARRDQENENGEEVDMSFLEDALARSRLNRTAPSPASASPLARTSSSSSSVVSSASRRASAPVLSPSLQSKPTPHSSQSRIPPSVSSTKAATPVSRPSAVAAAAKSTRPSSSLPKPSVPSSASSPLAPRASSSSSSSSSRVSLSVSVPSSPRSSIPRASSSSSSSGSSKLVISLSSLSESSVSASSSSSSLPISSSSRPLVRHSISQSIQQPESMALSASELSDDYESQQQQQQQSVEEDVMLSPIQRVLAQRARFQRAIHSDIRKAREEYIVAKDRRRTIAVAAVEDKLAKDQHSRDVIKERAKPLRYPPPALTSPSNRSATLAPSRLPAAASTLPLLSSASAASPPHRIPQTTFAITKAKRTSGAAHPPLLAQLDEEQQQLSVANRMLAARGHYSKFLKSLHALHSLYALASSSSSSSSNDKRDYPAATADESNEQLLSSNSVSSSVLATPSETPDPYGALSPRDLADSSLTSPSIDDASQSGIIHSRSNDPFKISPRACQHILAFSGEVSPLEPLSTPIPSHVLSAVIQTLEHPTVFLLSPQNRPWPQELDDQSILAAAAIIQSPLLVFLTVSSLSSLAALGSSAVLLERYNQVMDLLSDESFAFLFQASVMDWCEWQESHTIVWQSVSFLWDFMWHSRLEQEYALQQPYEGHAGRWYEIYAEIRIQMELRAVCSSEPANALEHQPDVGVSSPKKLSREEIELWRQHLGRNCKLVDASDLPGLRDEHLLILLQTCPQLETLDLTGSLGVSPQAVAIVREQLPYLSELRV